MSEALKLEPNVPVEARIARVAAKLVTVANIIVRHPERAHLLGPKSRQAAAILQYTGSAETILERTFRAEQGALLDTGSLSLVFEHPDEPFVVQKVNALSAHSEDAVIEAAQRAEAQYDVMQRELGELLVPTQYDAGEMHINPMRKPVPALVAEQQQFVGFLDILDPLNSTHLEQVRAEMPELRYQIKGLVEGIRSLGSRAIWVDLIGSNNVVLVPSNQKDRFDVRLLDVDPIVNVSPDDQTPSGRPVLAELAERIEQLESLAKAA